MRESSKVPKVKVQKGEEIVRGEAYLEMMRNGKISDF
jgi:hypothetical protein